jgi:hypothetical protein
MSLMCETASMVDFLSHTLFSVNLPFLLLIVVINLLVEKKSLHARLLYLEILRAFFTSFNFFVFIIDILLTNRIRDIE